MITLKVGQWVRVTGPFNKKSKNNMHLRKLGQVQRSVMHRGKLRALVRLQNSVGDSRYVHFLPDRLEASMPPPHPTEFASYTYRGVTVSDHVLTSVSTGVTSVHLPDHVVKIANCVFYSRPSPCKDLISCNIPPSVSPHTVEAHVLKPNSNPHLHPHTHSHSHSYSHSYSPSHP